MSGPYPSQRLRNILIKNRASLGLSTENINSDSSRENLDSQDELVNLVESLSLENNTNLENNNSKMENVRFHTSLLPTFSGIQHHLESFILAIDEFHALYYNNSEDQKKVVIAAIKSKLLDNARDFLLSRPDLTSWDSLKIALREKFGDPITYHILMQQLQYFKTNKNENILQFVDRLKNFKQRIFSKIQCDVNDAGAKQILISQIETTSVLILTANSPQTLKTMLMLQQPFTLDDAYKHVVNYNVMESQVNFTNNASLHGHHNMFNNNFNNPITQKPPINSTQPLPLSFPPRQPQYFPSQPIPIQPRPVQRNYPTNAQVFGKPKNVFAPQHNRPLKLEPPTPMSTSTAGPSRVYPQKQPYRPTNFFQPTGPRNFVSRELSNVETSSDPYYEEPYVVESPSEFYEESATPYNFDNSQNLETFNHPQYFEHEISDQLQDNPANFQNPASNLPST